MKTNNDVPHFQPLCFISDDTTTLLQEPRPVSSYNNDLNPLNETLDLEPLTRGGQLTRFLMRDLPSFFYRLTLTVALRKNSSNPFEMLYKKNAMPKLSQTQTDTLQRIAFISGYWEGVQGITQTAWPLVCLSLLLADFAVYYQQPNTRFLGNGWNILLGLSPNTSADHSGLASHLGSDLPTEGLYWLGWGLLAGSAALLGLTNAARYWQRRQTEEDLHLQLLWQEQTTSHLIEHFLQQVQSPRRLAQLSSSATLIALVDHRAPHSSAATALSKLLNHLKQPHTLPAWLRVYTHYQLWSIGRSQHWAASLTFTLTLLPLKLLTAFHCWRLLLQKLIGALIFLAHQYQCESDQKVWRLIKEIGDYACTVCDSIDYRSSLSGQGCLDQVSEKPQPFNHYYQALQHLQPHGPFNRFVLSPQLKTNWSDSQWRQFIELLKHFPFTQDVAIHAANPNDTLSPIPQPLLTALTTLLQRGNLGSLDLGHYQFTAADLANLLNTNRPRRIHQLLFTQGLLELEALPVLRRWLAQNCTSILGLRATHLTDAQLELLLQNNSALFLTELDLSQNILLTPEGLSLLFGSSLIHTSQALTLSGIDFSAVNISQLGEMLVQMKQLEQLTMQSCQLDGWQIEELAVYLPYTQLKKIDWRFNEIDSEGFVALHQQLPPSLQQLYIGNNPLDDEALIKIRTLLDSCPLRTLDLSNTWITEAGWNALQASLLGSELVELNVAGNAIRNVSLLAQLLPQLSLQTLNLAETFVEEGLQALFLALPRSHLTHLNLNSVTAEHALTALLKVLPNTSLQTLFLDDVYLTSQQQQNFLSALPKTGLRQLSLRYNELDSHFGVTLATRLLTPVPETNRITTIPYQNRDFFRAVHRAKPTTPLVDLNLDHNALDYSAVYALCLIQPSTQLSVSSLNLMENPGATGKLSVTGCPQRFDDLNNNDTTESLPLLNAADSAVLNSTTDSINASAVWCAVAAGLALAVGLATLLTLWIGRHRTPSSSLKQKQSITAGHSAFTVLTASLVPKRPAHPNPSIEHARKACRSAASPMI